MDTIKSYTSVEQSCKLAEILPLESADMFYSAGNETQPTFRLHSYGHIMSDKDVCAWSLAALLGVLPKIINNETLFIETSAALWHIGYRNIFTARADNPVDACYELILKLHELKML